MMTYTVRRGFHLPGDQVQRYGSHITQLTEIWGDKLTTEVFVEDARQPDSPTHDYFEWDNAKAAHEHRLDQARYLLRAIKPVDEDDGEEIERAFYSVTIACPKSEDGEEKDIGGRRVYVTAQRMLSDKDLRLQMVTRALRQLNSWRRQYEQLHELDELFRAIDTVAQDDLLAGMA